MTDTITIKSRIFAPHRPAQTLAESIEDAGIHDYTSLLDASQASPFLPNLEQLIEQRFIQEDFNPATDKLLLVGNAVVLGVALAVAIARFGTVQALVWDARTRRYQERSFSYALGNR